MPIRVITEHENRGCQSRCNLIFCVTPGTRKGFISIVLGLNCSRCCSCAVPRIWLHCNPSHLCDDLLRPAGVFVLREVLGPGCAIASLEENTRDLAAVLQWTAARRQIPLLLLAGACIGP